MASIRITKRIVDPITFQEYVSVEFLPRLEDTVLDDQLGSSMCFAAPSKPIQHLPPPPPPPPSSTPPQSQSKPKTDPTYRPPTPPKARKSGEENPNAPRSELLSPQGRRNSSLSQGAKRNSLLSPNARRNSLLSPKGPLKAQLSSKTQLPSPKVSPATIQRKSSLRGSNHSSLRGSNHSSLQGISEDAEMELDLEASLSNLSDHLETSLSKLNTAVIIEKKVRFVDEVETNEFSRAHLSMMDDLFYASEDLANFRYEAFMEEAGLDINDFD